MSKISTLDIQFFNTCINNSTKLHCTLYNQSPEIDFWSGTVAVYCGIMKFRGGQFSWLT